MSFRRRAYAVWTALRARARNAAGGLRRDRRGANAVEFALLAPLLFAILGGVLDFSRFLWFQTDMHQAVRAGMQHVISNPSLSSQAELNRVEAVIAASTDLSQSTGWSLVTDCGCGPLLTTTAMTTLNSGISGWGICQSTACPLARRYVRFTATYNYTALLGSMVPLVPSSTRSTAILRVQ